MKNIAVILSGCGHRDGSEITEAVSTLVSLSMMGADISCFAPDTFHPSIDHLTKDSQEARNALHEAARISRGKVKSLTELNPESFDALIIPGGQGAASLLCDWLEKGIRCKVLPEIERIVKEFYQQSKPIGAICIAPVILAKVLGRHEITLTLGQDQKLAQELEKLGCIHESCEVEDYITDRAHKIVTTPAYMDDKALPHQVFKGISGLVKEIWEMS